MSTVCQLAYVIDQSNKDGPEGGTPLEWEGINNLFHQAQYHAAGTAILATWENLNWQLYGPVWETFRGLLKNTNPKSYRWVRIGEDIADMESGGDFVGAPFFLGYQRRIMFFDHTENPRYLIGGSAIE